MPEGDTIYKTAVALRPYLQGQVIQAARAAPRFPRLEALVGATVTEVEPRGKHLLIHTSGGSVLHTHLRMTGSWHRYAPGERWRKPAHRASVVLEVPGSVIVCFSAPIVALLDERTLGRHHSLASLGPDVLAEQFDLDGAMKRLRTAERADLTLGEALLDQRAFAGVGNEYKSEILFLHRLHPWLRVRDVDDATLRILLETSERLLRQNVRPGAVGRVTTDGSPLARGSRVWVYGRARRPCFRCGSVIQSRLQGEQARITFWCPRCQPAAAPVEAAPPAARAAIPSPAHGGALPPAMPAGPPVPELRRTAPR